MYFCCCPLQEPGSSMTGNSYCSVGHLHWPARLPNCPTSLASPGHSNATSPATWRMMSSRRSTTTPTPAWRQTTVQVKRVYHVEMQFFIWPPWVPWLISLMFFSSPAGEDAQFEMDIWRESAKGWNQFLTLFLFTARNDMKWEKLVLL